MRPHGTGFSVDVIPIRTTGDQPTMDLLTQRMQIHEKSAWMLRSLLE